VVSEEAGLSLDLEDKQGANEEGTGVSSFPDRGDNMCKGLVARQQGIFMELKEGTCGQSTDQG
jgi:hypothetical protein